MHLANLNKARCEGRELNATAEFLTSATAHSLTGKSLLRIRGFYAQENARKSYRKSHNTYFKIIKIGRFVFAFLSLRLLVFPENWSALIECLQSAVSRNK